MAEVKDLNSKTTEHIAFATTKLESIETQTLKTNGRVSEHDKRFGEIEKTVAVNTVKIATGVFIVGAIASVAINHFF